MKLIHGDCMEEMKNIPNESIDMILTDPPYGITVNKWDTVIPFNKMWEEINRVIKPKAAIVLFGNEPFSSELRMSNLKNYKYEWVWIKNYATGFLNCNKRPLKQTEDIIVFSNGIPVYYPIMQEGEKHLINRQRGRNNCYGQVKKMENENSNLYYPHNVLYFPKTKIKGAHPTQKPVALLEYLIKTYTRGGGYSFRFYNGKRKYWGCLQEYGPRLHRD